MSVPDASTEAWGDIAESHLAEESFHTVTKAVKKPQQHVSRPAAAPVQRAPPSPRAPDEPLVEVEFPTYSEAAVLRKLGSVGATAEAVRSAVVQFYEDLIGNALYDAGCYALDVKLTGRVVGSNGVALVRLKDAPAVSQALALNGMHVGDEALGPRISTVIRAPVVSRPFAQPKSFKEAAAIAASKAAPAAAPARPPAPVAAPLAVLEDAARKPVVRTDGRSGGSGSGGGAPRQGRVSSPLDSADSGRWVGRQDGGAGRPSEGRDSREGQGRYGGAGSPGLQQSAPQQQVGRRSRESGVAHATEQLASVAVSNAPAEGGGGAPAPATRKKLQLIPRGAKPAIGEGGAEAVEGAPPDGVDTDARRPDIFGSGRPRVEREKEPSPEQAAPAGAAQDGEGEAVEGQAAAPAPARAARVDAPKVRKAAPVPVPKVKEAKPPKGNIYAALLAESDDDE